MAKTTKSAKSTRSSKSTKSSTTTGRHKRDKDFLRKPQFEGGTAALRDFIMQNLQYPAEALEKRIQGDVHVKFDVSEMGEVTACKVARAIGGGCDEEAVRVVKLLRYTPARNRGAHITAHHDIVIHFRLPMEHLQPVVQSVISPIQSQVSMNYTYVPSAPPSAEVADDGSSPVVFTWTVQHNPS